jgi:adenosylcobinamide kinase / adenosylcobinamide-phosphate guanylyltransferase
MALTMLLGGARSGKSRLAIDLANTAGSPVTFIATGEPGDAEMAERIAAHRATRPADWLTVEEPLELQQAVAAADPAHTVVVDCLTLWVANMLGSGDHADTVVAAGEAAAATAGSRGALTIAVSNEVGLGIVPMTPLARGYRDVLGSVNAAWVAASSEAAFVVAGRLLRLEAR